MDFKITEENHAGYTELYKAKKAINSLYINATNVSLIAISVTFLLIVMLSPIVEQFGFLIGIIYAGISVPYILLLPRILQKLEVKKVKKQYPEINLNIDMDLLEKELQRVGIIKIIKQNDKNTILLDNNGYAKYLEKQKYIAECENIKNKVINNYKIENDFSVSEEQLEKTKQKIKVLTK